VRSRGARELISTDQDSLSPWVSGHSNCLRILEDMKRLSQVLTGILVFATGSLADAPAVNSTSGLIIGHKAENTNSYEFLGIKYGQAPTGELRFASPKRYLAPEGTVFEASNWVNPSTL
jgi:hypothetical protein